MEVSNVDKVREAYRLLGEALGVEVKPPAPTITVANGITDPRKAKLGPLGEWTFPLLDTLAAAAKVKYPEGLSLEQQFQYWPPRWTRGRVAWPTAFLFTGCIYNLDGSPARDDLTDAQRQSLQAAHNEGVFISSHLDNGMTMAMRLSSDQGGSTAILSNTYIRDYDRLAKNIVDYFRAIGVE